MNIEVDELIAKISAYESSELAEITAQFAKQDQLTPEQFEQLAERSAQFAAWHSSMIKAIRDGLESMNAIYAKVGHTCASFADAAWAKIPAEDIPICEEMLEKEFHIGPRHRRAKQQQTGRKRRARPREFL